MKSASKGMLMETLSIAGLLGLMLRQADMFGGTEVSAGKVVEYGANHTKLSESLSLTLGENETIADYLVEEAGLAEIPPVLQGSAGNTYAQTAESDHGSSTTFFTIDDGGNQIPGYAETEIFEGENLRMMRAVKTHSVSMVKTHTVRTVKTHSVRTVKTHSVKTVKTHSARTVKTYSARTVKTYSARTVKTHTVKTAAIQFASPIAVIEEGVAGQ